MLQQHTSGIHIISLLALLSIRVASEEACPLRLWSHKYQPYVPRLGVNSSIVVQPSSVSQKHTAGFIALSRCSPSCLSGTLQERFAPRGTGPTSTCTTSSELGVNSGIIIQPSSVLQHHTAGFIAFSLCSLSCPSGPRQTLFAPQSTGSTCPSTTFHTLGVNSGIIIQPSSVLHQYIARSLASHSCLSGPCQMRLAPWALALRVPALRFLSWELTLASSYNPRQRCYGALRGFIAFSLCSNSCLSGLPQKRLAPCGTGPTRTCTTFYGLGVISRIIVHSSSECYGTLSGFLCSLSADTPVYQARFRRGLLQEALVFHAEVGSMRRWSSRYQHYVI